jgi:carboxyl-terminal processing protease
LKYAWLASVFLAGCAADGPAGFEAWGELSRLIDRESAVRPTEEARARCAANGLLAGIDPYSLYLSKAEYAQFKDDLAGAFTGVGVMIEPAAGKENDGYFVVAEPIEGGPAKASGVLAGDIIAAIDGDDMRGLPIEQMFSRLKGPKGSKVTLGLKRPGAPTEISISIMRAEIVIPTVTAELRNDVGIVRIASFSEQVSSEFKQAIDGFQAPIASLVIDLRKNPGGLYDQATAIADFLLDDGVIASGVGRDETQTSSAEKGDALNGRPIAILVDRNTASSAEILAGALQDRGRAFLVGEPTFGKGSIQRVFALQDGGAARLTTAYYEFASGARVEESGLEADLVTPIALPLGEREPSENFEEPPVDGCDFAAAAWAKRAAARPKQQQCPNSQDCQLDAALAELTRRRALK